MCGSGIVGCSCIWVDFEPRFFVHVHFLLRKVGYRLVKSRKFFGFIGVYLRYLLLCSGRHGINGILVDVVLHRILGLDNLLTELVIILLRLLLSISLFLGVARVPVLAVFGGSLGSLADTFSLFMLVRFLRGSLCVGISNVFVVDENLSRAFIPRNGHVLVYLLGFGLGICNRSLNILIKPCYLSVITLCLGLGGRYSHVVSFAIFTELPLYTQNVVSVLRLDAANNLTVGIVNGIELLITYGAPLDILTFGEINSVFLSPIDVSVDIILFNVGSRTILHLCFQLALQDTLSDGVCSFCFGCGFQSGNIGIDNGRVVVVELARLLDTCLVGRQYLLHVLNSLFTLVNRQLVIVNFLV